MDFLALKRFTKVQIAGCGGSGHVLAAVDAETKQHVAIKRLTLSNQYRSRQCLRELRIMRNMQHENVVKVYDILGSDGSSLKNMASETTEVKTLYVVQELLDVDLHRLIRSNALQEGHSKLLFFQLLRGIKYIHSANVQHRDLSPSNIFVNLSTLLLKIGDFGSARVVDPSYNHQGFLTANLGTCWYKCPEQIVTPPNYSKAIDMWSAGAILAEMLSGSPLFPGANELHQMTLILDTLWLSERDWDEVFKVMPNKLLLSQSLTPKAPIKDKFPQLPTLALDLLERLLKFDPSQRLTADEGLDHPYIQVYAESCENQSAGWNFSIEHEVDDLPMEMLKEMIVKENSDWLVAKAQNDNCRGPAEMNCDSGMNQMSFVTSQKEGDWKLAKKLANESKKAQECKLQASEQSERKDHDHSPDISGNKGKTSFPPESATFVCQASTEQKYDDEGKTDIIPGIAVETDFGLEDLEKGQLSPKEGTLKKADELAEVAELAQQQCNCCDDKDHTVLCNLAKSREDEKIIECVVSEKTSKHALPEEGQEENCNIQKEEPSVHADLTEKAVKCDLSDSVSGVLASKEKGSLENLLEKCKLETKGSNEDISNYTTDSITKEKLNVPLVHPEEMALNSGHVLKETKNLAVQGSSIFTGAYMSSSSEESLSDIALSKNDLAQAKLKLYKRKHMHKVNHEINKKLKEQKEHFAVSRSIHQIQQSSDILEIDDTACGSTNLSRRSQSPGASGAGRIGGERKAQSQGGARPKHRTEKRTY